MTSTLDGLIWNASSSTLEVVQTLARNYTEYEFHKHEDYGTPSSCPLNITLAREAAKEFLRRTEPRRI